MSTNGHTNGHANGHDANVTYQSRRSTRLFQTVHLNVSGQNKTGISLSESTSAVAVNCHGCVYPSRYEYPAGSWVSLQVQSPRVDASAQAVRAQVKFVRLPRNPRELYQVGVELESPANIWGIQSPPQDWLQFPGSSATGTTSSAAPDGRLTEGSVTHTLEHSIDTRQASTATASFAATESHAPVPAPASLSLVSSISASNAQSAAQMVSSDLLRNALEGVLQQAAEKAVAAALASRMAAVVNNAGRAIENFSQTSVRKVDEHCAQARERLEAAVRQEFIPRIESQIASAEQQIRAQIETSLAKAQEAAQRFEKAAADQTEARLRARVDEAHARLDTAAASSLANLHATAEQDIARLTAELREITKSSLASFSAESGAEWEARQRACQEELARAAQQEVEQVRQRLETILSSSMSTAIAAANEHSRMLFNSLIRGAADQLADANNPRTQR